MGTSRSWTVLRATALLAPFLTAACGGGGGGPAPAASTTPTTTAPTTTATSFSFSGTPGGAVVPTNTGISGAVAAPAPASFGTTPTQMANVSGGAAFDGKSGPFPANVSFPLLSTSLQQTNAGLSAAPADLGATFTVTNTSSAHSTWQLNIPSLNVSYTATNTGGSLLSAGDGPTDGFSYVVMGEWQGLASTGGALRSGTAYVFGYETPASAMPTTGTATFSGTGEAWASIYKTTSSGIQGSFAWGNVSASVNFASGAVSGSLTNMELLNSQPWNDVSLTANIAAGTNKFSGSTAVTSAPGTAYTLAGSATGHIDGAFYGPAAQNLGAVWSLSDGTTSVLGTITAKQ